jgi:hypothetical protein
MVLAGFEPTTPASEQPQSHALDRATTGSAWGALAAGNGEPEVVDVDICLMILQVMRRMFM